MIKRNYINLFIEKQIFLPAQTIGAQATPRIKEDNKLIFIEKNTII